MWVYIYIYKYFLCKHQILIIYSYNIFRAYLTQSLTHSLKRHSNKITHNKTKQLKFYFKNQFSLAIMLLQTMCWFFFSSLFTSISLLLLFMFLHCFFLIIIIITIIKLHVTSEIIHFTWIHKWIFFFLTQ